MRKSQDDCINAFSGVVGRTLDGTRIVFNVL